MVLSKSTFTREFQSRVKQILFYFICPWGENIFAKICYKIILGICCKIVYKNYDVRLHQRENLNLFNYYWLQLIQKLSRPHFY